MSRSFKLLDNILIKPHYDADGVKGGEWPNHLHSLLHLYRSVKETETIKKPTTVSSQNLIVQRLLFEEQPSENNVVGIYRTSVRTENKRNGHILVQRGDNTHDASGDRITTKPKTPSPVENRKKPSVMNLMEASNQSRERFDAYVSMILAIC